MHFPEDDALDLARAAFTRGMLAAAETHVIAMEFSSHVTRVVSKINDGKEATVYLCEDADGHHLAAKMYRARKFRAFANDSTYSNPARRKDRRLAKAIRHRSRKGVLAAHHEWVDREWQVLNLLFEAGASVPQPVMRCASGILMEYLGTGMQRAPTLAELRLPTDEAEQALASVLRDVETMLDHGLIHGDLSAYNVLYLGGRARMIDLPQAVRIDDAADPWPLFVRDITNLCDYFTRCGMELDGLGLAMRMWRGG